MSASGVRSPVRRLYDSLCDLMGADDLHKNLSTLEEYRKLAARGESHFAHAAEHDGVDSDRASLARRSGACEEL